VADAATYEGQVVRVSGAVVSAKADEGRAVLELEGRSGGELRVVIAPPLIGPRPAELVERFRGREVEAEGTIDDLGGLEMLVGDPEKVRVLDGSAVAAAPPPEEPAPAPAAIEPAAAARRSAPDRPARPASAPAIETSAAPAQVAAPPPPRAAPLAEAPPEAARPPERRSAAEDDAAAACARARATWRTVAAQARAPLARLEQCLAAARPPCRREADALRQALAEVAAAEERVSWLCSSASSAR
jgi:hypothetical protein